MLLANMLISRQPPLRSPMKLNIQTAANIHPQWLAIAKLSGRLK
jgi:hypothetical protein